MKTAALPVMCRLPVIILTLALGSAAAHAGQSGLLTVDRAVLTDTVDALSHNYLHPLGSPFARKRASLWMEVRGTQQLLDQIKSGQGKFTVHHVWRKYVFTEVETRLDQPLVIGRAEDLGKLSEQVAATGYFTWRTWSDKLNLSPGSWRVDLEFDGHEPVMCQENDAPSHPCSYPFEVE